MNTSDPQRPQDVWKTWLLERRFGGDAERMAQVLTDFLYPVRDKVLDHAGLQENETLLDVGCGDGLIAFGALDRLPAGRVIFADISQDLLEHARVLASQMGVAERCQFLEAAAEDLSLIPDDSVDVVTTRSVLIYVDEKARAFREFFRVLRPGGRISLFEPINRFAHPPPRHLFMGFEVMPIMDLTDKIKALYAALQPPDSDPMLNFDERDLVHPAEAAGFEEIYLELQIEIKPAPNDRTWSNLLRTAGNPKIPSLAEAMDQALTAAERERFVAYLRPLFEAGKGKIRSAMAYLWARKSGT